jgi:hypothetical protein
MRRNHDKYGKGVLKKAFGNSFDASDKKCTVCYGPNGGKATIDGTIAGKVAVEIESRASKQVRGAILDLVMNPLEKKVMILLPVHMANIKMTTAQCNYLLSKYVKPKYFRVIELKGHAGRRNVLNEDSETVKTCLRHFI